MRETGFEPVTFIEESSLKGWCSLPYLQFPRNRKAEIRTLINAFGEHRVDPLHYRPNIYFLKNLAAQPGFEPGMPDSKSDVLPTTPSGY